MRNFFNEYGKMLLMISTFMMISVSVLMCALYYEYFRLTADCAWFSGNSISELPIRCIRR